MTRAVQNNPCTPAGVRFSRRFETPGVAQNAAPGALSRQPSGLRTPEACKYLSPGYAFFAYPGIRLAGKNRTPTAVRGVATLLAVHFRLFPFLFWTRLV